MAKKAAELSTTIVIFGASGDLTRRKLIPALYALHKSGQLPLVQVIGYARRPYSDDDFHDLVRDGVAEAHADEFDKARWDEFKGLLHYFQGDLDKLDDFGRFKSYLEKMEDGPANRLYYLATAPEHYEATVRALNEHGMSKEGEGWRRIVIEKPYGTDLASAEALDKVVHQSFKEQQVYRIDHFLGKETVQNVLVFRFANSIFEPLWNRNFIDHVQITVAEDVDVGTRAGYYDTAGVMRDMFQNHMLQLLVLTAMEPPASFDADALRNEKVKVLSGLRVPAMADTVRAQYAGYRKAQGVDPKSTTATYAALKLYVDNWRWQDVPFYLRSGKAMKRKTSEINVQFRRPPKMFFDMPKGKRLEPNILSICIQPDEGVHLAFGAKVPGSSEIRSNLLHFHYNEAFGDTALPDAYERLLLDALQGDATLFTREDEIRLQWKLIDTILAGWNGEQAPPLVEYPVGSWGPEEAEILLADDGRVWRHGCGDRIG
ncbi:MAG TPA: glucose-6-phosphate dehydrogenase [Candidatus Limnocylindrales bacterium]|nr:glucose-6-phosphate dehydrogenase [Candidatus Limnocylindrales bacterium]